MTAADLVAELDAVTDPQRRLEAARNTIVQLTAQRRELVDTRDAMIYAGVDAYRVTPIGKQVEHLPPWRRQATELLGMAPGLFQKIDERRARLPEDHPGHAGYYRYTGPVRELFDDEDIPDGWAPVPGEDDPNIRPLAVRAVEKLPDVPTLPTAAEHWAAAGQVHAECMHLEQQIDAVAEQVRDPALLERMHTVLSNVALVAESGLSYSRIQKMRLAWRAGGQLPDYPVGPCAVCGWTGRLRNDGTVRRHRPNGAPPDTEDCPGATHPPAGT